MPVYTVHEPPPRKNEVTVDPDRFVFVRDGFGFWAFLLAPLWMLWHRLWLVFLGYLLTMVAVETVLYVVGASATVKFLVGFLVSLLVGIEAASLRRWTLTRRGARALGVVVGDDLEMAEQRFFDSWVRRETPQAVERIPTVSGLRLPPASPSVIGLFPEPGAPR